VSEFFAATEYEPLELRGEVIRQLRREVGLTQVELANRLDVTEATVANWENERTRPRRDLAIDLVQMLEPTPVASHETRLLPPRSVTLSADRPIAVSKRRGQPPVIYFTKAFRVVEP